MESKISHFPGMNGQHIPTKTNLGKMAGGPALKLQGKKNLTLPKKLQLGPCLHPVFTQWVYSPSQELTLKRWSQGWTEYL